MAKISFIIIGRNEGWTISTCLNSVLMVIKSSNIKQYEIIFVDSDSKDNSIQKVLEFNEVKIFKLQKHFNAAIARNLGALKATGEIFIFVDGDMELDSNLLNYVLNENKTAKYDFVSGNLIDVIYDSDHNEKGVFPRTYQNEQLRMTDSNEKEETFLGAGVIICKREVWQKMRGMNSKYRRSQDRDLSLRLLSNNYKLIRRREIFAKHHTIDYLDKWRMWRMIIDGAQSFRAVLLRDHFLNKRYLRVMLREEYTLLLLVAFIPISLFFKWSILLYFIIIIARCLLKRKNYKNSLLSLMAGQIVRDIIVFLSIFLFHPSEKKINYIQIR